MEGHDHSTVVAAHQMEEETMEGAADRVVVDMVAAACVPPPANAIKQYSIRVGVSNCRHGDEEEFCSKNGKELFVIAVPFNFLDQGL